MSRVWRSVAVSVVVLAVAVSGCGGDDGSDDASAQGQATSTEPGQDTASGDDDAGGSDVGDPDGGSSGNGGSGSGDDEGGKGGDGGDGGEGGSDDPVLVDPGPCEAVVPLSQVAKIIDDPAGGALSSGGEIINSCTWLGSGDASLTVEALDASVTGQAGIDAKFAKHRIKNLGKEAGSATGDGNPPTAAVQVYAEVKGSGKPQPVLYVITWKGDDARVDPLVNIARRIV